LGKNWHPKRLHSGKGNTGDIKREKGEQKWGRRGSTQENSLNISQEGRAREKRRVGVDRKGRNKIKSARFITPAPGEKEKNWKIGQRETVRGKRPLMKTRGEIGALIQVREKGSGSSKRKKKKIYRKER